MNAMFSSGTWKVSSLFSAYENCRGRVLRSGLRLILYIGFLTVGRAAKLLYRFFEVIYATSRIGGPI